MNMLPDSNQLLGPCDIFTSAVCLRVQKRVSRQSKFIEAGGPQKTMWAAEKPSPFKTGSMQGEVQRSWNVLQGMTISTHEF